MNKEKFVERLGQLVEIQTYSDNAKINAEALDLIESWVDKKCVRERVSNGNTEILLLGSGDIMKPKIGYLVHVDVVKGNPEQFKMKSVGDKLLGRGVSEMKFSIPIGVELLNMAVRGELGQDITLAITTDEEVGGGEGGKYLAEVMKFQPEIMVVPDGGDGFVFVNKAKGVVHLWVESHGVPAHASVPWDGSNALAPICRLANVLLDKYENNSKTKNWETTMNLGFLAGGKSANQVCPEALLKIDFRFPETRSFEEIFTEVREMAGKIDSGLKVTIGASGNPTYTDINTEAVEKLLKAAETTLGKKMEVGGEYGASDARYWAKLNIPIIMTKPEGGDFHGDNEWISAQSCVKFYELMLAYIKSL